MDDPLLADFDFAGYRHARHQAKMYANFFQSIRVDHFNTCAVHRGCFRIDQRGLLIFLERAFTDLSDDSIDGAVLLVGK